MQVTVTDIEFLSEKRNDSGSTENTQHKTKTSSQEVDTEDDLPF